jgi:hypothetical protein
MLGNPLCFGAQAGVKVWLSAAGLSGDELYFDAQALENRYDRLPRLRVERIDQAGHIQLGNCHAAILIQMKN